MYSKSDSSCFFIKAKGAPAKQKGNATIKEPFPNTPKRLMNITAPNTNPPMTQNN